MTRIIALSLGMAALASAAQAQDLRVREGYSRDGGVVVSKVEVPYADLDLSTQDGARRLLARIERAAEAACGASPEASQAGPSSAQVSDCRRDAIRGAASRLRSPTLEAAIREARPARLATNRPSPAQ
jgi:UrcA family protein